MRFSATVFLFAAALVFEPQGSSAADGEVFAGFTSTSWLPKDGLPSPSIAAITQSHNGYLWLGSSAGLVRFDGVRFITWDGLGGPALPESLVRALCSSRNGDLWIGFGNLGGVSRIRNGSLENYTAQDGLPDGAIRTLLEDRDGTMWAGGFNGLARFRNGRWERVGRDRGLPDATTVDSLYEDSRGDLFVATTRGLLRLNRDRDALERTDAGFYRALDVIEDAGGSLWLTGQRLPFAPLTAAGLASRPPDWEMFYGYRLLRDVRGNLWIATLGQGLIHVPGSQWNAQGRLSRFTRQQGLSSDWVTALFEDREGNIWVGTQAGLNRLSAYRANPVFSRTEFAGQTVRAVTVAPDGSVWTGTGDGLHRLSNGKSEWFREEQGLPSATIRVLHTDARGELWVATSRGPARFAGGRFSRLVLPENRHLDRIEAMASDPDGGLWLCDFGGVYRWKDGVVSEVVVDSESFKRSPPSAVYLDAKGRVWIGFSGGGVSVYHNDVWRHYTQKDGLSDGGVRVIYEDRRGAIWVGTLHGLSKLAGQAFISITDSNGLPGNRLTAIVEGDDENLWVGTDVGLVRLRRDEFETAAGDPSRRLRYRLLDASDGLDGVPTAQGQPTSARSVDGGLWFVTSEGMAVLNPRAVNEYPAPSAPITERVLADDRVFLPVPGLRLPARTESVQFDFTSLTFADAPRILFRYKLDGHDPEWVDAGTRRQAFYANLAPRTYQFRVAASRGEGLWIESPGALPFSIAPAFHQSAWFFAACAAMPALGLWAAWRLRLRQVRRQFAVVLAERERLAREIHDTLLQGMLGVALQLHGLSETLDASDGATKKRCERARDYLEHYIRETRQSIWDLRSPTLEAHDLATALRETAENLTTTGGVRVSMQVSGRPRSCGPDKERHVLRIGHEAITNAVRHAKASEVRVDLRYEPESLLLRVVDDGRGFDVNDAANSTGAHWGLRSMQERAAQAGALLELTSRPGNGTVVELVLEMGK